MTEKEEKTEGRTTCLHEECCCPVCTFMRITKEGRRRSGGLLNHFLSAQIEILQAVKSFVDVGISTLEKRRAQETESKPSKSGEA